MDDILFLLNWGKVEPGLESGDGEGQVFRVIGTDVEEEPLTVVKIITDDRLLCITGLWRIAMGEMICPQCKKNQPTHTGNIIT